MYLASNVGRTKTNDMATHEQVHGEPLPSQLVTAINILSPEQGKPDMGKTPPCKIPLEGTKKLCVVSAIFCHFLPLLIYWVGSPLGIVMQPRRL